MFKLNVLKIAGAIAILAGAAQFGSAQTINQRLNHQHSRIHNGYKNHDLNKYQRTALRDKDKQIHAEEHFDRLTHKGHLTKKERAGLEKQLNRNSKRIYGWKHNK